MSGPHDHREGETPEQGAPDQSAGQATPDLPAHAEESQEPAQPQPGPHQDQRGEPPLVAFGIVIGTAVGGIVGLIVGAFLLGAGVGCAAGVIIGAAAQALRSRG
ncbi:MAG: hypothetical protein GX624_04125 [Actinobacteria bacterium]|nr:hypothetical protein [Actinomycetota bacterium]